jgi:putative ABC transport system permease protein
MGLNRIVIKNIKEHLGRFVLLAAILSVSIGTVVALYILSQAMYGDLQNKIDEYGANMVIVPKTKNLPLSYAGVTIGFVQSETKLLNMDDVDKIRKISNSANINVVSPKLLGIMSVDGEKAAAKKVLVEGVRFEDEFKLKQWWGIKSGARPNKANEVLVGGKIARVLNVGPGDSIVIKNEKYSGNYKVGGVLKMMGSQDDELIYMNLSESQRILNKPNSLSIIEVSAWCRNCPIDDIVAQIAGKIPTGNISAVRQAAELRQTLIDQFKLFAVILSAAMISVASLIMFANVLGSVYSRRREIGIFRAMGYRRRHIMYLIMQEVVLLGIASGVVGTLAGYACSGLLAPSVIGIDNSIGIDFGLVGAAIGFALFIAVASGVYPALKASNISPVEAINSI